MHKCEWREWQDDMKTKVQAQACSSMELLKTYSTQTTVQIDGITWADIWSQTKNSNQKNF